MSNWYGTSRTNYVRISDEAGLKLITEKVGLTVHRNQEGLAAFFPSDNSDDGGWPSFYDFSTLDSDDSDKEFDFATDIMPFVEEGQVLITMSAGAEKQRYVSGHAEAFIRKGKKVRRLAVSLNDIYRRATQHFKVAKTAISDCSY